MGWEGIAALASCAGLLLAVGGMVYALGKIVARMEALEGRVNEDRAKNDVEHKGFAETAIGVAQLNVHMQYIRDSIDEVKASIAELVKLDRSAAERG